MAHISVRVTLIRFQLGLLFQDLNIYSHFCVNITFI